VLDEEGDALLGHARHERRAADAVGYRNGHGTPRQVALMNGTITGRRRRVRGLDARFASRTLPLCQRRTPVGARLLPERYRHGLATGAVSLALRGRLGDGAPLRPRRGLLLREDWPRAYAPWCRQDRSALERLDGARHIVVQDHVELLRQPRQEILALAFGLRPVDHADRPLQARGREHLA
jgi:hypothetical protein